MVDKLARDYFNHMIRAHNILIQDISDHMSDRFDLMISRDAYRDVIKSMAHLHGFPFIMSGQGYILICEDESTLLEVR